MVLGQCDEYDRQIIITIDESRAFVVVVVVVIGALYLNGVECTQVSDLHITY